MSRSELMKTPCSYFFKEKAEKKNFMQQLKQSDEVDDFEVSIKARSESIDCLMSIRKIKFDYNDSIAYHGSLKNITFIKENIQSIIKEIVEKNENERQKSAAILHESLAQKLAGIKFYMAALKEDSDFGSEKEEKVLNAASSVLDKAIEELRAVCIDLVPQSIHLGLDKALEELCILLEASFEVSINREFQPVKTQTTKPSVIFRFFQELLVSLVEEQRIKNLSLKLTQTQKDMHFEITSPSGLTETQQVQAIQTKVINFGGGFLFTNSNTILLTIQA